MKWRCPLSGPTCVIAEAWGDMSVLSFCISPNCFRGKPTSTVSQYPPYQPGQKVWLFTKDLPLQVDYQKLAPRFVGPFETDCIINPSAVHLQLPPKFIPLSTFLGYSRFPSLIWYLRPSLVLLMVAQLTRCGDFWASTSMDVVYNSRLTGSGFGPTFPKLWLVTVTPAANFYSGYLGTGPLFTSVGLFRQRCSKCWLRFLPSFET